MPHEYEVTRKLQEQRGSYFVFLPKLWVEACGLKERDEVSVTFNDAVTIRPTPKEVT
jgi:hypothetical protein